ncbi:hypothetical protein WUBG_13938 [Wuchereria bancrofti]|uniref:Uncharacterized protein n=1 Tax=Wuchereria bancrofti TaxID=6293 RepID=J9DZ47_WUCBA|nr:hypothetical protein WUBG_13938 [Wuchereria bancrofti]VDM07371.1 unnamed protein product [Wuchereria bancrofti]
MSAVQPLSNAHQSLLFRHNGESEFHLGHFDRFVDGVGEIICAESGLRYIFGPESIDLGPCCNSCDENWTKILKNEDVLVFSRGYTYSCGSKLVQVAKQVIIPETCNDHKFLGVVLRECHPSSTEGATAAFLCPPFGIIKLHKFAFGCNSDKILWPPVVGTRFWVVLSENESPIRVWKVDSKADDVEFGLGSTLFNIPKLYLWQWNKTFNESGIFAITDFVLKTPGTTSLSKEIEMKCQVSSNTSTSTRAQDEREKFGNGTNAQVNNAAVSLLLEILNDQNLRDLVIQRHQEAFENYLIEISRF